MELLAFSKTNKKMLHILTITDTDVNQGHYVNEFQFHEDLIPDQAEGSI